MSSIIDVIYHWFHLWPVAIFVGKTSIVVASEEEVRGLDFKDLYHVFLFDIPRTAEEYLHLAGRVGRLGKEGMVTTVIPDLHDTGFQRLKDIYKRLGITGNEIII